MHRVIMYSSYRDDAEVILLGVDCRCNLRRRKTPRKDYILRFAIEIWSTGHRCQVEVVPDSRQ